MGVHWPWVAAELGFSGLHSTDNWTGLCSSGTEEN